MFNSRGKFANYCSNCTLQEKAKLKCNCQVLSAWKPSQVTCLDLSTLFPQISMLILCEARMLITLQYRRQVLERRWHD